MLCWPCHSSLLSPAIVRCVLSTVKVQDMIINGVFSYFCVDNHSSDRGSLLYINVFQCYILLDIIVI